MQSDDASQLMVDHSQWQLILDAAVKTDASGLNRVDYQLIDAQWRDQLQQYLNLLTSIDPRTLHIDEQFAYWVNLYNALTIEVVLRYPRKKSILRMGEKLFSIGPWDDKLLNVAGQNITLNDIEHRILRPIWQDHRIHYAVNCASIGCPNLSQQAYTRANLEQQLQVAEDKYTNHERGIRIKNNRVRLSSIYKWYREDFGTSEFEVLQHLSQRNAQLASKDLAKLKVSYDYDWKLNHQP